MNDIQKQKRNFRATAAWKKFKNRLKANRKVDALTLKPLRAGWNCHHMDLADRNYTDLSDETHFLTLNKMSHEVLHAILRYALADPDYLKRLEKIVEEHRKINKIC
jgi:hypothetical protein